MARTNLDGQMHAHTHIHPSKIVADTSHFTARGSTKMKADKESE